jgi:signal transduction histidine kinase
MLLKRTDFNLLDFLKESVEECRYEDSKHEINIVCDANLMVNADKHRLDQVICNLVTNAIKYSPDADSIDITVEKEESGKVKVSVIDQGIGIPKDQEEEVFARFHRVESTSQNFSGIGLGLYISSEIIKHHGGEIGVKSELGKGSAFWFSI